MSQTFLCARWMPRLRFLWLAAIACVSISDACIAGTVTDRIKSTGIIRIGYRESSVPMSYLDGQKKPVGYALDLCYLIAEHVRGQLGLKKLNIELQMVTSANRIDKVAGGEIDLECGSTTNNRERRQRVAFTVPHYIGGARFLVAAESPISSSKDFERKKLASTKGSTPLKAAYALNNLGLRAEIVEVNDHLDAVKLVEQGAVDGFIMDDVLLYGLISGREHPEKLKVVGRFATVEPLAIALPKTDPEFKAMVDSKMKTVVSSPLGREIYAKWFLQPIPPFGRTLNLPMSYLLRDMWSYPTAAIDLEDLRLLDALAASSTPGAASVPGARKADGQNAPGK